MKLFIDIVMKRIYLFNIVAWNYRKKIGFPVYKRENFAGLSSAPEAGKERSCQSYSASHIKWRAERSFHCPTFIRPALSFDCYASDKHALSFDCYASDNRALSFDCYVSDKRAVSVDYASDKRALSFCCYASFRRGSCRFNKICETAKNRKSDDFLRYLRFFAVLVMLTITQPDQVAYLTKFAKIAKNYSFDIFSRYLWFLAVLCPANINFSRVHDHLKQSRFPIFPNLP